VSLIVLSAPLIRLAAAYDGYAQDLFEAVDTDGRSKEGLVQGPISEDELSQLTPTEWQWYANWRQSLGGKLDRRLLDYLTAAVSTRFARFEVRALVLRDGRTNRAALGYNNYPDGDDTDGTLGLHWLSEQAYGVRVFNSFRPAETYWRSEYAGDQEQSDPALGNEEPQYQGPQRESDDDELSDYPRAAARAYAAEWDELVTDALQCATDASWYLLRELMSDTFVLPPDPRFGSVAAASERIALVEQRLNAFANERGLNPGWYNRGQPLRLDDDDAAGGLATE
jgi:hypothetical protein